MAKGTPAKGAAGNRPGSRPAGTGSSRARKPPPVVTRQPRPWGWIAASLVVALFAAAAIGYAVVQVNERNKSADPANLESLVTKTFPAQLHNTGPVDYGEDSPPFGGTHYPEWADCNGDVYPDQIASEYAVHGLEHGAVWITYSPDLPQDDVDTLAELVDGQSFLFMSPYAGLRTAVSLQSWGHQLFVDSVDDSQIEQFIIALRRNVEFTPELGASCDNPAFAANPVLDPLPGTPVPNQTAAPTAAPTTVTGSAAPTATASVDPSATDVAPTTTAP